MVEEELKGEKLQEYRAKFSDLHHKIVDIMSDGKPRESHELYSMIGGYIVGFNEPSWEYHLKYLVSRRILYERTFTVDVYCDEYDRCDDSYYHKKDVTIYWIWYRQEYIDQKKEIKEMVKATLNTTIEHIQKDIERMDKALP